MRPAQPALTAGDKELLLAKLACERSNTIKTQI